METRSHFSDIHQVIIRQLEGAQSEITTAVAWFTDRDIFEVLCRKAGAGVKVAIALVDDNINQGRGKLNFHRLTDLGGRVIFLPPGTRDEPLMHHKFCVIDRGTVITGSYNWTHKARSNDENVIVATEADADFVLPFLDAFDTLVARAIGSAPPVVDADAVRRRLELIRNLVMLGEQDEVGTHLHKLRPAAEALELGRILAALDAGEYRTAIEQIDAYLRRATALVAKDVSDIPRLRFALRLLEMHVGALTDEKAEIERRLTTFSRRYDDCLGDLLQRVLNARAEQGRLRATTRQSKQERAAAEEAADEAEEAYQSYSQQHEQLQLAERVPALDDDDERDLKALYRKACSLCHPDKVSADRMEAAHHVFVELQAAYKRNDLARVREIHDTLQAGGIPGTRSGTLTEADALRAAIAEMEHTVATLLAELKDLQTSEGARLMDVAGTGEAAWQQFFERQRETLKAQLAAINSDMQVMVDASAGAP